MTDSFFTTQNVMDRQLIDQKATALSCELLLEASLRRIVKLEGTSAAGIKMYRLADICAAANVQPIDLLRAAGKHSASPSLPSPAQTPKATGWRGRAQWVFEHIEWKYWFGLAVGLMFGALWFR